jgi:hypothetical protein
VRRERGEGALPGVRSELVLADLHELGVFGGDTRSGTVGSCLFGVS